MMLDLLDLLVRWMVSDSNTILFSLSAAILVPIAVAMRRFRAMGLRVSFTLSIYTACFLFFLLILHHKAQFATDWANLLLYSIISILHVFVYLYHLAFGFAWNLRPGFIYTAGLPGYCFFLAIMLFVPGFIFARLCSLVIALASSTGPGVWAVESLCSALPSPLTDELVLVALFSLLFTWSIIFHQVRDSSSFYSSRARCQSPLTSQLLSPVGWAASARAGRAQHRPRARSSHTLSPARAPLPLQRTLARLSVLDNVNLCSVASS